MLTCWPVNLHTDFILHNNKNMCKAFIDSGSQVLAITTSFAKSLGLEIQKLKNILGIEGLGAVQYPTLGLLKQIWLYLVLVPLTRVFYFWTAPPILMVTEYLFNLGCYILMWS